MALELDTRQRAMLQEMGVHVWLPESGVAILEQTAPAVPQARSATAGAKVAAPAPIRLPAHGGAPGKAVPMAAQMSVAAAEGATSAPGQAAAPASVPRTAPADSTVAGSLDWTALTETVRACQACASCSGRANATLLPPAADPMPCDWMVVGDPPDEDEDRAGAPFAGPDGVLLANMLRALGLQRANPAAPAALQALQAAPAAQRAYVTNVLKCRPAHGAMPQAAELAQCAGYLRQEIALVQPKVILAMGRFANQLLLSETPALAALPLGKLRGTVHRYQGIALVLTYAPRQLMRNSSDKAKAWADLCLAAATLET
jgi:DNA polymerase